MRKLKDAEWPLPEFANDEEAAEYFETHSVANIWDKFRRAKPLKPAPALSRSIRERHLRPKSPISIRLDPEQIAAAKKTAARKSIGYQTQLRLWIAEGIRQEARGRSD